MKTIKNADLFNEGFLTKIVVNQVLAVYIFTYSFTFTRHKGENIKINKRK